MEANHTFFMNIYFTPDESQIMKELICCDNNSKDEENSPYVNNLLYNKLTCRHPAIINGRSHKKVNSKSFLLPVFDYVVNC